MYVVSFCVFRSEEEHCNVYETLAQNTFDCSRKTNNNISFYNREASKSKIHVLTLTVMDKHTSNMNKYCS